MKRYTVIGCILALVIAAALSEARPVDKRETIEKTFRFKNPAARNLLVVDNIWGSVTITGTTGNDVIVKVEKVINARTDSEIAEAESLVSLEINEEDALIELYVDGPFRDHHNRSRRWRKLQRSDVEVHYTFEIQAPKSVHLDISTVNDGEITVTGIDGDYDVHNVNGDISMNRIGGSGDVYTVNGEVTVDFTRNPKQNSRFGTLNGELKLHFMPDLSADFHLKTFNGEIFSDFPVSYLPIQGKTVTNQKDGKYIYKTGRTMAVRTGKGGPEILLDGFNGDMYILEKD